ncbi:MAG: hypothetical protein JJE03_00750 [Peptostreptococcaceae bacterium]|nr:hypothetical protein [Peptostreptococcaceae bacterium]
MVAFDKKTMKILKYVHNHSMHGITWGKLQKKFGKDYANIFLLENLNKEQYIITKNVEGEWINFELPQFSMDSRFVSFATTKANEMIERKYYDFWKWMIPMFISAVAVFISILALLSK